MSDKGCKFSKAWIGDCGQPTVNGTDYCKDHAGKRCVVCGAQATHECPETRGLVCGERLCDTCEHKGMWGHARKGREVSKNG